MATYSQIMADIRIRHTQSVKSCWIAHVKELNGLPLRKAHNRKSPKIREVPCPDAIRPIIEASMRRLGMIK